MVKIFSPLQQGDTLGQTFGKLTEQIFGDRSAQRLNNEKVYAAERENVETDNLIRQVAQNGVQRLGADGRTQGMLIGSGYDPGDYGKIGLQGAATAFGAKDPRTQNWQVGTGQSFDNTADAVGAKLTETARNNNMASGDRRYGVDQGIGQQRYEFDNTPMPAIGADGQPAFGRRVDLVGDLFKPVLSDAEVKGTRANQTFGSMGALPAEEQEYLGAKAGGAAAGTPKNYRGPDGRNYITYDGRTSAQDGAPLPAGGYMANVEGSAAEAGLTSSVASDVQRATMSTKRLNFLLDQADKLAQNDSLFGVEGKVRSWGQELAQGASGLSNLFGAGRAGDDMLNEARADLRKRGLGVLLPSLYDPDLPAVQTVWGLLLYQAASAIAGQSGRDISNKDIQDMKEIFGDPQGVFSSAEGMRSKLKHMRNIAIGYDDVSREALGPGGAPVARSAPAAAAPGMPAAPAPTAPAVDGEGWIDIGGVKIRRKQQ